MIKDLFGILVIIIFECDKLCGIREYLDHKNCKFGQKIAGELVEECSKNIGENKMIYSKTLEKISLSDYKKVCVSCTLYIVLFAIFFVISRVISAVFMFLLVFKKKKNVRVKFNADIKQQFIRHINENSQAN